MARFEPVLAIDAGLTGDGRSEEPFRVRLEAGPLLDLIADARAGRRVYELMLLTRPGDVWPWIEVVIEAMPRRVREHLSWQLPSLSSTDGVDVPPVPLPWVDFDHAMRPRNEGDLPEQWAWGGLRDSAPVRDYARGLLAMARDAVDGLPGLDPLLAHIVSSVRDGSHPFHWIERARFVAGGRRQPPARAVSPRFLGRLDRLLRDGWIASAPYRGDGDWHVLRAMASEQRRRAAHTGHRPGHALHLSALSNLRPSNDAWGSAIWYFDEGLAVGDAHVEQRNAMGRTLRELANGARGAGRYVLADFDAGEWPGWSREVGEGYAPYEREAPASRREGMARIHER